MRMQALAVVLFGTLIQASAPAQAATVTEWTVDNVKMRMQTGTEVTERKVSLRFGHDRLEIYSTRKGATILVKQLPYTEIEAADYRSFGGSMPNMGFLGGRKHWLTIRCGTEPAFLMLDKSNHEEVRRQFSDRTSVAVHNVKPMSSRAFHVPASL